MTESDPLLNYAGTEVKLDTAFDVRSHERRALPPIEKIIRRSSMDGPCYVYTGRLTQGYGHVSVDGAERLTHVVAWESLVGPVPDGLTLDHLCRNHACWWPDHLRVITKGENTLAGYGPTAQLARQKLCHKGHALRPRTGKPGRMCDTCNRDRARAHREKRLR